MYCPEHKIFCLVSKRGAASFSCWLYWRDVPRDRIPLAVWLNLLRYEVSLRFGKRAFVWNREGLWYGRLRYWLSGPTP